MDPLNYLLEKPMQDGRTAKWLMLLTQFDITYVTQKSIKGRAIAEYLAQCPIAKEGEAEVDFPDEDIMKLAEKKKWNMYFDGAANRRGCGIGILLVSPEESHTPLAIKLNFLATNNIVEYEACILRLEAAYELGIED